MDGHQPARLADEMAIRTLQQDYFRTVDAHDWAGFGAVLCADAVFDFSQAVDPGLELVVGREGVVAFVREAMSPITSAHSGFLRSLEFTRADEARALWAMQDMLWTGEPGALKKLALGHGHYHLEYRREDGAWRIARWLLTRIHMETF